MPARKVKKQRGKKAKKVKIPFPSDSQKRSANNVHPDGRKKMISADLAAALKNLFI